MTQDCIALQKELKEMKDAALVYQELATCYRIGKNPTEKLFSRLDKAHILLSKEEA